MSVVCDSAYSPTHSPRRAKVGANSHIWPGVLRWGVPLQDFERWSFFCAAFFSHADLCLLGFWRL